MPTPIFPMYILSILATSRSQQNEHCIMCSRKTTCYSIAKWHYLHAQSGLHHTDTPVSCIHNLRLSVFDGV